MKHFITTILLLAAIAVSASNPKQINTEAMGVWVNDSVEAVITKKACIVFRQLQNGRMTASAMCPIENFYETVTFNADSTITATEEFTPELSLIGDALYINGSKLKLVERIESTPPYDMPKATSKLGIGSRLQEWRLGVTIFCNNGNCGMEINTNRHMFIFLNSPNMTYIRAAATANNNKGTVFWQNIRMMRNNNTKELTSIILPHNARIAENDIDIDNSKFHVDECAFIPDGSIYWSLIDFTPDLIRINGCGETYTIPRPTKDSRKIEWLKFIPYSEAK